MPPPDPYNLGYDAVSLDVVIQSSDSNYKLFKDVNGEVFARYIGTNCRNGPPVKQIWVLKELITNLFVNADANELSMSSVDNSSNGPEYEHVSSNHFVHRESQNKNAYSYDYPDTSPMRQYSPRRSSNASKPPVRMWVVKKN